MTATDLQDLWPDHHREPYCLARDIRGIGFLIADKAATKLGIEKAAMIRVRAAVSYAMDEGQGWYLKAAP